MRKAESIACSLLVVSFFCFLGSPISHAQQADEARKVSVSKRQLHEYIDNRRMQDQWWFPRAPLGETTFAQDATLIKEKKAFIEKTVNQYRYISPLSMRIAEAFPRVSVTVYTKGYSMAIYAKGDLPEQDQGFEVCFIPQEEIGSNHPSLLYYKAEWEAVLIAGFQWPQLVFASQLFHEMGHALYHIVDKSPSSMAPPSSDLYISEEVVMHELEGQILDRGTQEKFSRYLDEIIERVPSGNFKDAIFALTIADLYALDGIVGCQNCGTIVASFTGPQYMLSLGFRFIDRKMGGAMAQKIALYRWFTNSTI